MSVEEPNAIDERLDEITDGLATDLRDLGVESVERPAGGRAPTGAKGHPVTVGTLMLAILPAALPKLIEFLQSWAMRREERTVSITTSEGTKIELTPSKTMSHDEIVQLVEKLS